MCLRRAGCHAGAGRKPAWVELSQDSRAPTQLSSVVMEREQGLRQALKNMGMLDSAFWLSWGFTELLAGILFSLLIIGFGAAFQFDFFLNNSFGVVRQWEGGGGVGC